MSNPDDDTDVPSGFNDDAEMERTSPRTSEIYIHGCASFPLSLFLLSNWSTCLNTVPGSPNMSTCNCISILR